MMTSGVTREWGSERSFLVLLFHLALITAAWPTKAVGGRTLLQPNSGAIIIGTPGNPGRTLLQQPPPGATLEPWRPLGKALAAACPAFTPDYHRVEDAAREACQYAQSLKLVGSRVRDVPFALCAAHAAAAMAFVDDCHLLAHAVGNAAYEAAVSSGGGGGGGGGGGNVSGSGGNGGSGGGGMEAAAAAEAEAAATTAATLALGACDPKACIAGCVHGVVIAHLRVVYARFNMDQADPGSAMAAANAMMPLAGVVTALCHDTRRPQGLSMYDCVHGAGHGLAAVFGGGGGGAGTDDNGGGEGGVGGGVNLRAAMGACSAVNAALRLYRQRDSNICGGGVVGLYKS
jgi:hypothetical protein